MTLAQRFTLCPVPVGLNAGITAFRPKLIFKSLDENPVPWKEVASLVNLWGVRIWTAMEEVGCIHLYIQVYMNIGEVYAIGISGWNGNDLHAKKNLPLKYELSSVIGGIDGGSYLGVVWCLGETLKFPRRSGGSTSTSVNGMITLTVLSQAVRSAELMLLHSFLTLGDLQAALAEVKNRAEKSATRRTLRKAIPEPGARR